MAKELKSSYVFATATGFKVVNKDTLQVTRHAGTEEEIKKHEEMGVSKGALLNEKINKTSKKSKDKGGK